MMSFTYNREYDAQEVATKLTNEHHEDAERELANKMRRKIDAFRAKYAAADIIETKDATFREEFGYTRISETVSYTAYKVVKDYETHYYTTGYTGSIDSSGDISLTPDTSSESKEVWKIEKYNTEISNSMLLKAVQKETGTTVKSKERDIISKYGWFSPYYNRLSPQSSSTEIAALLHSFHSIGIWTLYFIISVLYICTGFALATGATYVFFESTLPGFIDIELINILPSFISSPLFSLLAFFEEKSHLFIGIVANFILGGIILAITNSLEDDYDFEATLWMIKHFAYVTYAFLVCFGIGILLDSFLAFIMDTIFGILPFIISLIAPPLYLIICVVLLIIVLIMQIVAIPVYRENKSTMQRDIQRIQTFIKSKEFYVLRDCLTEIKSYSV